MEKPWGIQKGEALSETYSLICHLMKSIQRGHPTRQKRPSVRGSIPSAAAVPLHTVHVRSPPPARTGEGQLHTPEDNSKASPTSTVVEGGGGGGICQLPFLLSAPSPCPTLLQRRVGQNTSNDMSQHEFNSHTVPPKSSQLHSSLRDGADQEPASSGKWKGVWAPAGMG